MPPRKNEIEFARLKAEQERVRPRARLEDDISGPDVVAAFDVAQAGGAAPVLLDGDLVAQLFWSCPRAAPIPVSPGHRVSPESALRIVRGLMRGHRLPKPRHVADRRSKRRP